MEKFENFITIRLLMQGKVSSCFDSIKIIYTNYYYYSSFFSLKEVGSIIGKVINHSIKKTLKKKL